MNERHRQLTLQVRKSSFSLYANSHTKVTTVKTEQEWATIRLRIDTLITKKNLVAVRTLGFSCANRTKQFSNSKPLQLQGRRM